LVERGREDLGGEGNDETADEICERGDVVGGSKWIRDVEGLGDVKEEHSGGEAEGVDSGDVLNPSIEVCDRFEVLKDTTSERHWPARELPSAFEVRRCSYEPYLRAHQRR